MISVGILGAIALYLIAGEPFVGIHEYKKLVLNAEQRGARLRFYRNVSAVEWGLTIVIVLTVASGGISWRSFGFQPIDLSSMNGFVRGLLIAIIAVVFLQSIIFFRERSKQKKGEVDPKILEAVKSIVALLPRNKQERWAYTFVSITAGVCEEVLFRGLTIYLLHRIDPALSTVWTVVISSIIFGVAHAYQGIQGIVFTALAGAMFAVVYTTTHTLYIPMIVHALIDLRALMIPLPRTNTALAVGQTETSV